MVKRTKLTDDEQRAIIGERLSTTLSTTDSELRKDRETALDHYYGRPYGNEIEGRSQVVTKDLMDVIEWMMPSLLRIFAMKDAVQFDAVGPEDEEQAKQETAYVTHVLWKKNAGFMLIYNWLKDGLMQKVGYVQHSWVEEEKVSYEPYTGLSDEQLDMVYQDLQGRGEVEVEGQEQAEDGTWSVKFKVKTKYGCEKVDVVQPDEIIVDSQCRGDVKNAKFVGRLREDLTNSDLIEMGYPRAKLESLTDYVWKTGEGMARDTVGESTGETDSSDWSTRKRRLLECYTYIDTDGDGVAELRHYLAGGNDFLENEEFPEIPFCSWTPIPIPHRHVGLSIDDTMEDQQRINTALNRGLLDNVYFTMNPRSVYDKNTIDVGMLQINRPGGHVANDGPPGMSIMPMPVAPMAGALLPVIDYVQQVTEKRTGVGRMTSGVDADVLAQSTKGAYTDAKSAANQRIEQIARIFAETGLSALYCAVHRDLNRHQDHATQFKVKENWITTNPTEWRERTNMTVSVGLGNSSKDEIRANLMMMGQGQMQAAQVPGLIQPQNVFNLFNRMATELGFEQAGFITDPKSPEYQQFMSGQQAPPNPLAEAEQIKGQTVLQKAQIEAQTKDKDRAQERDLTITTLEVESGVDLAKAGIGAEVALARGAQQERGRSAAAAGKPGAAGSNGSPGARPAQPDAAGFPGG
jgi:hypothetical protein